jgi:hypothetical protein
LVPRDDRVDLPGVSRCEQSLKFLALNLPEGGFVLIHELTHDLPAAIFGVLPSAPASPGSRR